MNSCKSQVKHVLWSGPRYSLYFNVFNPVLLPFSVYTNLLKYSFLINEGYCLVSVLHFHSISPLCHIGQFPYSFTYYLLYCKYYIRFLPVPTPVHVNFFSFIFLFVIYTSIFSYLTSIVSCSIYYTFIKMCVTSSLFSTFTSYIYITWIDLQPHWIETFHCLLFLVFINYSFSCCTYLITPICN